MSEFFFTYLTKTYSHSDIKHKNYSTFQRILRESGKSQSNVDKKFRSLSSWGDVLSFLSTIFQVEEYEPDDDTNVLKKSESVLDVLKTLKGSALIAILNW